MLIYHMATQAFWTIHFMVTEQTQVLSIRAALLEMQVEPPARGELDVTLLTPVKGVTKMGVCNVLAEGLKNCCLFF